MPIIDLSSVSLGDINYLISPSPDVSPLIYAQDIYSTWAAEIGVSSTGSDEAVNQNNFVRTFNYGTKLWDEQATDDISISSEGAMWIYKNGIPTVAPGSTIAFVTIPNVTPMVGFTDLPDVMLTWHFRGTDTELTPSSKIRTANGVTIMQLISERQNVVGTVGIVSLRLELGKLTVVGYAGTSGFPAPIIDYYIVVFDGLDAVTSSTLILSQTSNQDNIIDITVPIPVTVPSILPIGVVGLTPPTQIEKLNIFLSGLVPSFGFLPAAQVVVAKTKYSVIITGSKDSTSDINLPISFLSLRLETQSNNTTQITVPDGQLYSAEILKRPNGLLMVKSVDVLTDGSEVITINSGQAITSVQSSQGSKSFSITITSSETTSITSNPKEYKNIPIILMTIDGSGNIRLRIKPITEFKLGDSIRLADGRLVTASSIVTTVRDNIFSMEIANG